MLSTEQALIIATVTVFTLLALAWQALRAWSADGHDVGPDALGLLEELDTHLDEYVDADPELADGFDRLRDAVREQQQEDQ